MPVVWDRLAALVLSLGLLLGSALAANAQGFDGALARLSADSFSETETAITEIAASGHAMAAAIIQAMQEGRLFFNPSDKKVYIKEISGQLLDASTGQPAAGVNASDLMPVRINNRLRRAIEAALGGLTLLSPDPGKRLEAAQAVFKSRDASALPTLETAIAKETDPKVKHALLEARAAVVLNLATASEADKLAAVAVIRARGDQDALAVLGALPADTPPAVMRA